MKKVLISGWNGQRGWELTRFAQHGLELIVPEETEFDITRYDNARGLIASITPSFLINCAGHTAVDKFDRQGKVTHRTTSSRCCQESLKISYQKGKIN